MATSQRHKCGEMFQYYNDQHASELGVGYERWCALRRHWLGQEQQRCADDNNNDHGNNASNGKHGKERNLPKKRYFDFDEVDVEDIVERLVDPARPPFSQPVPLGIMVAILQEVWESDGEYD